MLKTSSVTLYAEDGFGSGFLSPLVTSLPTFTSASHSVVLSAAAYIAWKFPTLPHPWHPHHDFAELPPQPASHESPDLSLHPLFEGWCDLICESILSGDAVRLGDELSVLLRVPYSVLRAAEELGTAKLEHHGEPTAACIFGFPNTGSAVRRLAILNFATSQLRVDQLQPKINILALLLGCLFDNQRVDYFRVLRGEIPSKTQLALYDAVIMPGSSYSALDSVPEIDLFVSELRQALDECPQLRVLSICFGHQVISHMFGAQIVRKQRLEGQEDVVFAQEVIARFDFLSGLAAFDGRALMMPEHHQDYVETLPTGFALLGWSQSCKVEAMVSEDGRLLCFQFHPEYLADYAVAFERRLARSQPEYKLSFDLSVPADKQQEHLEACTEIRLCMARFLA